MSYGLFLIFLIKSYKAWNNRKIIEELLRKIIEELLRKVIEPLDKIFFKIHLKIAYAFYFLYHFLYFRHLWLISCSRDAQF